MAESIEVDGSKCTQIGVEDGSTGLNVFDRLFIDRVEVFPSAGGLNPTEIAVSQLAHGFSIGDVLYNNGTLYAKAKADDSATSNALGVVVLVTDANNFVLQGGGFADVFSGLTPGTQYYLSPTVAGAATSTRPSTPDAVVPIYASHSSTVAFIASEEVSDEQWSVIEITASDSPYTLTRTRATIAADTTGGDIEILLPAVASSLGYRYDIAKDDISGNVLKITPNGSEQIIGEDFIELIGIERPSVTPVATSTRWIIV
jgi:hypothetical protein